MARFHYLGDREHIFLGPPVRVMSPGKVVDGASNPDPARFEALREGETPRPGNSAPAAGASTSGASADSPEGHEADPDGVPR